jgi:hypothetical protein
MPKKNCFRNDLTQKIAGFLNSIGIAVIPFQIHTKTFLPGILVENGKLLIDQKKLTFPGDLLHEAGHLAVAPASLRDSLSDEVILPGVNLDVLETQAIAWSYAACLALEIDPQIVFHEGGYKGQSDNILFNFNLGIFLGLNGLESCGMAFSEGKAKALGVLPYPKMQKWLRD